MVVGGLRATTDDIVGTRHADTTDATAYIGGLGTSLEESHAHTTEASGYIWSGVPSLKYSELHASPSDPNHEPTKYATAYCVRQDPLVYQQYRHVARPPCMDLQAPPI